MVRVTILPKLENVPNIQLAIILIKETADIPNPSKISEVYIHVTGPIPESNESTKANENTMTPILLFKRAQRPDRKSERPIIVILNISSDLRLKNLNMKRPTIDPEIAAIPTQSVPILALLSASFPVSPIENLVCKN